MHTKLKLKIELFNDDVFGATDKSIGYFVKMVVLSKDDRFDIGGKAGDYLRFGGSDFSIKVNKDKKYGSLNDHSLILPHSSQLGITYTKYFETDNDRYNYLMVLYNTLKDWGSYWWGFEEDSVSKIKISGNIWEVQCEKANLKIMDKVTLI